MKAYLDLETLLPPMENPLPLNILYKLYPSLLREPLWPDYQEL